MRFLLPLLLCVLCVGTLTAQSTISAARLIDQINSGADIALTNATITGDLDFTRINDRERENSGNWGKTESYRYHVRVGISFVNCTFEGDVLAYRNEDEGKTKSNGPLHNADFHEDVLFRDCKFEESVNFKYTSFHADADFPGAEFDEKAGFKYTEFSEAADFNGMEADASVDFKYTNFDDEVNMAGAKFGGNAVFKYTKFPRGVDFSKATFEREADFKYAEFPRGVNMANTTFRDEADFKYTKFSSPANFNGTDFGRDPDFKYTQLDGDRFRGSR